MDLGDRLDELLTTYAVPGVPGRAAPPRRASRRVPRLGRSRRGADPLSATTAFHAGSLASRSTGLVVLDARPGAARPRRALCGPGRRALGRRPARAAAQTTGVPTCCPSPTRISRAFVARVGALPRVHAPGRFSYCNAGWSVLDLLLRRRTRRRVRGACRRRSRSSCCRPTGPRVATPVRRPEGASRPHAVTHDGVVDEVPGDLRRRGLRRRVAVVGDRGRAPRLGGAPARSAAGLGTPRSSRCARPARALPGGTVFDSWGHGWAIWDRGAHQAFGWAGYTGGHRAYLRCFPDQDAALVVLANAAGPAASARPGGSRPLRRRFSRTCWRCSASRRCRRPTHRAPTRPAGRRARRPYGPLRVQALPRTDSPTCCSPTPASSASREPAAVPCVGAAAASSSPGEPPGEHAAGLRRRPAPTSAVRPAR